MLQSQQAAYAAAAYANARAKPLGGPALNINPYASIPGTAMLQQQQQLLARHLAQPTQLPLQRLTPAQSIQLMQQMQAHAMQAAAHTQHAAVAAGAGAAEGGVDGQGDMLMGDGAAAPAAAASAAPAEVPAAEQQAAAAAPAPAVQPAAEAPPVQEPAAAQPEFGSFMAELMSDVEPAAGAAPAQPAAVSVAAPAAATPAASLAALQQQPAVHLPNGIAAATAGIDVTAAPALPSSPSDVARAPSLSNWITPANLQSSSPSPRSQPPAIPEETAQQLQLQAAPQQQ